MLYVVPAQAQVQPEGSISFLVGAPQGEFRDNVTNPGFGVDLFAGLGLDPVPVVVGVDLGVLVYGREVRKEPFSTTIPDVTVDVETTNNIFQSHFVLRLQPLRGPVRPYVEGLAGFKYLFTQTQIESERINDNEPIASSTNFDDFALSYGFGGGMAVMVSRGGRHFNAVELKAGAQYLLGAEAEYLKEGSIRRQGTNVTFDVDRSRTTLFAPHLGVSFRF